MKRRDLLCAWPGLLGAGTWLAASPAQAHLAPPARAAGPRVHDSRCGPAPAAAGAGAPVWAFAGDVSPLWFTALRPHLIHHHTPVTGLSWADALFCIEHLAQDMGWQLTQRTPLDGQTVAWQLAPGPSALLLSKDAT